MFKQSRSQLLDSLQIEDFESTITHTLKYSDLPSIEIVTAMDHNACLMMLALIIADRVAIKTSVPGPRIASVIAHWMSDHKEGRLDHFEDFFKSNA